MKHIFIGFWMFALTAVPSSALAADNKGDVNLLGEYRLLVLCLPNGRAAPNEDTALIFNTDWEEFEDRDLRLLGINQTVITRYYGKKFQDSPKKGALDSWIVHTDIIDEPDIRARVNCTQDSEVVLIGKDTGVKARWDNNFSHEDLFSRIDAMPMRRFEIRQQKDKN